MGKINKTDMMIELLMDTNVKVGKVEEHLKDMNGSINRHNEEIKDNREDITSVRNRQYWMMGIGTTIVTLSGIIFTVIKFKYGG